MRKAARGESRSQNSQEVGDSSLQETSCSPRSWELWFCLPQLGSTQRMANLKKSPREEEKLKAKNCECHVSLKKVFFFFPLIPSKQSTCDLCCSLKIKHKTQHIWRPAVKNFSLLHESPGVQSLRAGHYWNSNKNDKNSFPFAEVYYLSH